MTDRGTTAVGLHRRNQRVVGKLVAGDADEGLVQKESLRGCREERYVFRIAVRRQRLLWVPQGSCSRCRER